VLIDAHQHFWRPDRGDYGWLPPDLAPIHRDFGPADLRPLIEAAGIAGTILVQAAPTLAETRHLLDLADAAPEVAGVVGWVDLEAADAPATLRRLALHARFKGVRPMLQDLPDPAWVLRPSLDAAIAELVDLGLRFDALVRLAQLPAIRELARRHPSLKIVLDHGGKPPIAARGWRPWADEVAALAAETGAFVKLSGLSTEAEPGAGAEAIAPYVRHLLEAFGPDRVMWGSDWPVLLLASDYAGWLALARSLVPQAAHAAVFGGTAARFYDIGRGPG